MRQNDYCFILQPLADHQGSKNPIREHRWTGPYIVEKVLLNKNYIVRKLNCNKTQILHHIRLREYEPNTVLQDSRPEGNLQQDDETVIPRDDLYVISWETNFEEFHNSNEEVTIPTLLDAKDNCNSLEDDASPPGEIFTDVDLWSTGPHENKNFEPPGNIRLERRNDWLVDQQSSEGMILSCPKYQTMKTMIW